MLVKMLYFSSKHKQLQPLLLVEFDEPKLGGGFNPFKKMKQILVKVKLDLSPKYQGKQRK